MNITWSETYGQPKVILLEKDLQKLVHSFAVPDVYRTRGIQPESKS